LTKVRDIARRYSARFAKSDEDIAAAQALRGVAFRGGQPDDDAFDQNCSHVLVEDMREHLVVCVFRIQPFASGREIESSYAAQFYELSGLKNYPGKLVEMGRFCVKPGCNDPDIIRVAWGAMTKYVDENNVKLLFGCSSFQGAKASKHLESFALLNERHLAPQKWSPKIKSPKVVRFAGRAGSPDIKVAHSALPPLLRTYLLMGGWVSDHAVVDNDLNTLHVFTGLEIGAIPASRKRLLRAVAN